MAKKPFKHFADVNAVLAYVASEIVDTLQDDLDRQEGSERQHYTNGERKQMRNRIADIEKVTSLISNAGDAVALLRRMTDSPFKDYRGAALGDAYTDAHAFLAKITPAKDHPHIGTGLCRICHHYGNDCTGSK